MERGSLSVLQLFQMDCDLGSSEFGFLEITAAISRRRNSGTIDRVTLAALMSDSKEHWQGFYQVKLGGEILQEATRLAGKYGLRAGDAIHLASATQMASQFMDRNFRTILVSSDLELNSAAQDIGFEVLDPNLAVP